MNPDDFVHRINRLIESRMQGFEETYGYPPEENEVVVAPAGSGGSDALIQEFGGIVPDDVLAFFDRVQMVSLPDFWNAYFIGPVSWIIGLHSSGDIRFIKLSDDPVDLIMLGSDGGGTMYGLVPAEANAVYSLPLDRLEDGVYVPTYRGAWGFESPGFGKIAEGFSDFLWRFTIGLEDHVANGSAGPFHY
jgi:hypothetical protein